MKNPRERSDSGVSEVVGTILTLGITVTLFSGVFLMLGHLPEPTGVTYANFDMTAEKQSNGTVKITIVHSGGESLKEYSTAIYMINSTTNTAYRYNISDGLGGRLLWKPGESWIDYVPPDRVDFRAGYLYIYDLNRGNIIWRGDFSGNLNTPLPPIIMDRGTEPSPVSTASPFRFYVYVQDPNDDFDPGVGNSSLTMNVSALHLYSGGSEIDVIHFTHDIGYKYISPELNVSASTPIGSHVATVVAKDEAGNEEKSVLSFVIGEASSEDCDIYVSEITFVPQNPVSGDSVRITVTFSNAGDSYGYCIPRVFDGSPNGTTREINVESSTVYVAAHGESSRTYIWSDARPAGLHNISVNATIPSGAPTDTNLKNNNMTEYISIVPKILLVDDDHDEDYDTSAYMKEALNATGYSYDVYKVAYAYDPGPQYSTLSQYDVVIWMCGKDSTHSITVRGGTTSDVYNLEKFLDDGGKLWIVGENVMNDLTDSVGSTFMSSYMGVSPVSSADKDVPLPSVINATSSSVIPGVGNISLAPTGYSNGKYTDYIQPASGGVGALQDKSNGNYVAISHEDGYKTMFFSFEFSTIKYSSDRAEITYQVLKWLSGMEGKTGHDVSISGVRMDPEFPLYKDNVNITIYVRNNGWTTENVTVQLLVDLTDVTLSKSVVMVKKNGGVNITFGIWDANILGKHHLVAKVDPYNEIEESDETNNVMTRDFIVRFRSLLVDDDSSSNNGGTEPDRTGAVQDALEHLLSTRDPDSSYMGTTTRYNVSSPTADGPSAENLSSYNAVIWVTGDADSDTFTSDDMKNIRNYLNGSGMLWVIGTGFVNDLLRNGLTTEESDFLEALGIDSYSMVEDGASGFSRLEGITDDPISHGMDFTTNVSRTVGADVIPPSPSPNSSAVFTDGNGNSVGVRYQDGYKVISTAFDINATSGLYSTYSTPHFPIPSDIGNRTRYEITYMVMHWFGEINTNPEMKVGADFYINGVPIDSEHLVLGQSYVLEAKIHNVGDEEITYTTARFYDGDSIIGSTSVSLAPDATVTASIIWKPSYAGAARPLRVILDYHEEVREIPNPDNMSQNLFEYNNEAVHYVPVYFFWDDMENGTANWMHTANVVNINGENPIDFLGGGYTNIYTNVIYQWNETMSHGGVWTDQVYHSYNRSFWLKEPSPTGVPVDQTTSEPIPIDVVFVIDSSGSMAWDDNGNYVGASSSDSRWYNARVATINFIQNLTEKDRASIWTFDGNGNPYHLDSLSYMTTANKNDFISDLNGWTNNVGGGTPIRDTIGDAINDILTNTGDSDSDNNDRLDFVVALTDGADTASSTYSATRNWGDNGLLHAPPMIYTIGVVDTNDLHPSGDKYPTAGDDPNWQPYYDTASGTSNEYDLWHIANSSLSPPGKYGRDFNQSDYGYHAISDHYPNSFTTPNPHIGHYYFAKSASQIGDIFSQIREIVSSISTGNGQTAGNGNVTRSSPEPYSQHISGTRASTTGSSTNAIVQTRYMRSDDQTVNGLDAYILGTTQSTSYTYTYLGYGKAYAGIRVWKRDASGTETEITSGSAVAVASTTSPGTLVSATWTCPKTAMDPSDSIVVRVYAEDDDPSPDELVAEFTTEALGAGTLDSSTWTVYYYLDGYGYDYFYWGDSTANSRIEGFTYSPPPPTIPGVEKAYPSDGNTSLPSQYVAVVFNKSMDTSKQPTLTQNSGTSVSYTFEGWFSTYTTDDTAIWSHDNWSAGDHISLTVSNYWESTGTKEGVPYTWSFDVYSFTSTGTTNPAGEQNTNKTAVTESFDLSNVQGAVLTFWHKYSIVPGMNGAFIELGYKDASNPNGPWKWNYMIPAEGAYTGNLNLSATRTDSDGTEITWGWNGVSGKGTFSWEFVKVNLMDWIPAGADRSQIRVKFNYTQYGLGTGYGWYIDDVKVVVSRSDSNTPTSGDSDVWQLTTTDAHSGRHAWWNGDPSTGYFKAGIDNSLISRPIDLTNAWNATLSAYFKFNINTSSGAPPDGFRVEISKDGGESWTAINLGVRSAWGVSGSDNSADQTVTGVNTGNYWVEAGSLTRLNVDLTAFRGNVILLRFRVVTTNAATYQHYDDASVGFGGFYLDDVVISGESLS